MKLRVEEKSYGIRLTSPRDESGHGDTFSAFSGALLVGHEIGGKRLTVVGSVGSSNQLTLSPLQRALAQLEIENAMEQHLAKAGSDPSGREGLKAAFRQLGRG
jgi:hypothetical protein